MTPTVAPKRFCDHEVIGKALMCVLVRNMGSWSWPTLALLLDPLRADAFNAAGGRYDLSCQDVLSSWYMTVMPCRISGLCTRVCDPGGAERSHRCCVIPTFGKILIFPDLTWVSDVGYDSPWFAMRCGGFKAIGLPLDL